MRTFDPDGWQARALRWAIAACLALGFAACIAKGADGPPDPVLSGSRIEGFGQVGFTVRPAGGGPTPAELCALLAETQEQRAKGLMTVTDLGGYRGMVFRFAEDTTGSFFMRNTPMPLSIAWFGADGAFVSAADMEPCPDQDGCPTYPPTGHYRYALEVPLGGLPALGVGPGSTLELEGDCPAAS